jgi:CRISPR-associated protein Cas1
MSSLILDRTDLEIRLDGNALALYEPAGRRGTVPIKLLDRIIIQGGVKLDAGVLTRLAESGVATLMLSKRHSKRIAIVLGLAHNDAGIRLAQSRRVFDPDWCIAWAARQVKAKTRAQIRLLQTALASRPDARKPLTDALASLRTALTSLPPSQSETPVGSSTPPPLPAVEIPPGPPFSKGGAVTAALASLRGIEGAAARAYFQGLAALFPPSLNFTGRNRRPPRDPVNACLSLGYTLLHFDAVRACHIAGLDPLLGFYHRPSFGRESLASDLIEPLRPHLDAQIWQLFRGRSLREDHFSQDGNACLLGKTGRGIFYQDYETHVAPVRRMLQRQCRILAKHLKNEGEPLLAQDEEEEDFA